MTSAYKRNPIRSRIKALNALEEAKRGKALLEEGFLDDALDAFDKALALCPEHATYWNLKGDCSRGNRADGGSTCGLYKAIAKSPCSAGYWKNKGLLLAELGHDDESARAYNHAEELKMLQ